MAKRRRALQVKFRDLFLGNAPRFSPAAGGIRRGRLLLLRAHAVREVLRGADARPEDAVLPDQLRALWAGREYPDVLPGDHGRRPGGCGPSTGAFLPARRGPQPFTAPPGSRIAVKRSGGAAGSERRRRRSSRRSAADASSGCGWVRQKPWRARRATSCCESASMARRRQWPVRWGISSATPGASRR